MEEAAADEESVPNDEEAPTRTADKNATPEEERGGSGCRQISSALFLASIGGCGCTSTPVFLKRGQGEKQLVEAG